MELTLLRHGIPVEPEHWSGEDSTRPLTPRGMEQTHAALSALLKAKRLQADEIWSSPYMRCIQTAQSASQLLGLPVRSSPALASGSSLLLSLPKTHGDPRKWPEHLLCIGHAPDLGQLASMLTGGSEGGISLGRAGTARLSGAFETGQMKLLWLLSADQAITLG